MYFRDMLANCSSHTTSSRSDCWRPSCPEEGWACHLEKEEEEFFWPWLISTQTKKKKKRKRGIWSTFPARLLCLDISKLFGKHAVFPLWSTTSSSSFSYSQCLGRDVNVLIDTGCRLNLISSLTVDRLGWEAPRLSVPVSHHLLFVWRLRSVNVSLPVLQPEGAGGGGQDGGWRTSVPEEPLCGQTGQRSGPYCGTAQDPLLLRRHGWEKGLRIRCGISTR